MGCNTRRIGSFVGRSCQEISAHWLSWMRQTFQHKCIHLDPNFLIEHKIPFVKVSQCVGEFVVSFPQVHHFGYNQNLNVAEATNWADERWIPYGKKYKQCKCEEEMKIYYINKNFFKSYEKKSSKTSDDIRKFQENIKYHMILNGCKVQDKVIHDAIFYCTKLEKHRINCWLCTQTITLSKDKRYNYCDPKAIVKHYKRAHTGENALTLTEKIQLSHVVETKKVS